MARRIGETSPVMAPVVTREVGRGGDRDRARGTSDGDREAAGGLQAPSDRVTISPDALRGPLGSRDRGERGQQGGGTGAGAGQGGVSGGAPAVAAGTEAEARRLTAGLRGAIVGAPAMALRSHDLVSAGRVAALLRG